MPADGSFLTGLSWFFWRFGRDRAGYRRCTVSPTIRLAKGDGDGANGDTHDWYRSSAPAQQTPLVDRTAVSVRPLVSALGLGVTAVNLP